MCVMIEASRNTEFAVVTSNEGWVKVALTHEEEGWIPETEIGAKIKQENGKFCLEIEFENAWKLGAIGGEFQGTEASSGNVIVLKAKSNLSLAICPKFPRGPKLKNGGGWAGHGTQAAGEGGRRQAR